MRAFFPLSARAVDIKSLLIVIALYLLFSVICGFALNLVAWIPLLGKLISLISKIIDLYCLGGIVVAIMICFDIR